MSANNAFPRTDSEGHQTPGINQRLSEPISKHPHLNHINSHHHYQRNLSGTYHLSQQNSNNNNSGSVTDLKVTVPGHPEANFNHQKQAAVAIIRGGNHQRNDEQLYRSVNRAAGESKEQQHHSRLFQGYLNNDLAGSQLGAGGFRNGAPVGSSAANQSPGLNFNQNVLGKDLLLAAYQKKDESSPGEIFASKKGSTMTASGGSAQQAILENQMLLSDGANKHKNASYFSSNSAVTSSNNVGSLQQNPQLFKLPNIKAPSQGDANLLRSPPLQQQQQRISHQFEAIEVLDTDRRKNNNNQPFQQKQEQLKGSMQKKSQILNEDLILKNAKILPATGVNGQQQQYMILVHGNGIGSASTGGGNLTVNGLKHDILLQEGKRKIEKPKTTFKAHSMHQPSVGMVSGTAFEKDQTYLDLLKAAQLQQQTLASNSVNRQNELNSSVVPLVKKQFNYQYANMRHRHMGGSQQIFVSATTAAAQRIDPNTSPLMMVKLAQGDQSEQPSPIFNDAQSNHYGSVNRLPDTMPSPPLPSVFEDQSNPSITNPYGFPPPDLKNQGGATLTGQVSQTEFLSPKLLYKKKKRDYYQSQSKTQNQQQISNPSPNPLLPITQNQRLFNRDASPKQQKQGAALASTQINNVINQLLLKNNGQQHINFVQALKNINITQNQLAVANQQSETLDQLKAQHSFASLGKSASQDHLDEPLSLSKLATTKISLPYEDKTRKKHTVSTAQTLNNINALAGQPPLTQADMQQQPMLQFKQLNQPAKNNRVLTANELYELAKQIKYKQLYSIQARRAQHNSSPNQTQPLGIMLDKRSPKDVQDRFQGSLKETLNVVKIADKKIVTPAPVGMDPREFVNDQSDLSQLNFKVSWDKHQRDQLTKNIYSQYKLDSQFMIQGQSPQSVKLSPDQLGFVIRYTNRNNEVQSCYEELPQVVGRDFGNTSSFDNTSSSKLKNYPSKSKLPPPTNDCLPYVFSATAAAIQPEYGDFQEIISGVSTPGKIKTKPSSMIQNSDQSYTAKKTKQLSNSFLNYTNGAIPQQQILISQVQDLLNNEDIKKDQDNLIQSIQQIISEMDPVQLQQLQLLALSQPMKMISEADEQMESPQTKPPIVGSANVLQTTEMLQKELRMRVQRKKMKVQQLQKITKINELEKLLYQLPGLEEGPVINMNPGGGGRVTNRVPQGGLPSLQQVVQAKRRVEPQITDNDNEAFQEHVINKTIKMMGIMNALMFKINTKEQNPVQVELFSRCTKFFGLTIPKQFKNDFTGLMKQKDFLAFAKERMATLLVQSLNKTNNITEQLLSLNQSQGSYKYYIGGGNNHMLVKSVFKQRSWWIQNEKENFEECNFIWTQWLKEKHIKVLPKFEGEGATATSSVANCQDPQEQEYLQPIPIIRIYNKMHANQCLSDKKHLFFNMRDMYKAEGKDPFTVLPLTYVVNDGLNDIEFDRFEEKFKSIEYAAKQKNPNGENLSNIWIIKPGEDTNRGSGIIVSKDFAEIKALVRDKSSRQDKTAILQKYIENPLLINKRKFDIRCYGLLTCVNGIRLGFFYSDGYLRTSSKEFSISNLSNRYIHLTNDAIQKNSEDYGKFENANKLSFSDFDKYFAEFPIGDYELRFTRDFLPQIRAMVRDTFRCVEKKIDPDRRTNTFEIFGYDFMIDDELNIKLIEVNTNPSIEVCCPLLARILPNMLDSVFRIAIDPLFQQPPSRRVWNGTEMINDLKMELVFESPATSSQSSALQKLRGENSEVSLNQKLQVSSPVSSGFKQ